MSIRQANKYSIDMSIRLIGMTLQQIFIANLKKIRKERGFSQMALSEKCDTTSNYIGQIEMGRRIPSFEKIEKIAAALEIPSFELFMYEAAERKAEKKPETGDYLQKMPQTIKKELISRLLAAINKDVKDSFDSGNYK
jgi:transcriptional regulator with XRE-family HTH domain